MIRGGDGKLKGKRNHSRGWPVNRRVLRDWRRGLIHTVFMYQGPLLMRWNAAEDHTNWSVK